MDKREKISFMISSPTQFDQALEQKSDELESSSQSEGTLAENRALLAVLRAARCAGLLTFPLRIEGRGNDSPDFRMNLPGKTIGIEHTVACNQRLQWARNKPSDGNSMIPLSCYSPDDNSTGKPPPPIKQNLNTLPAGTGWRGNDLEKDWLRYVGNSISEKLQTLERPHFQQYDEDWLVIDDDTPAKEQLIEEELLPLIEEAFLMHSSTEKRFTRIFIFTVFGAFTATDGVLSRFEVFLRYRKS